MLFSVRRVVGLGPSVGLQQKVYPKVYQKYTRSIPRRCHVSPGGHLKWKNKEIHANLKIAFGGAYAFIFSHVLFAFSYMSNTLIVNS